MCAGELQEQSLPQLPSLLLRHPDDVRDDKRLQTSRIPEQGRTWDPADSMCMS